MVAAVERDSVDALLDDVVALRAPPDDLVLKSLAKKVVAFQQKNLKSERLCEKSGWKKYGVKLRLTTYRKYLISEVKINRFVAVVVA